MSILNRRWLPNAVTIGRLAAAPLIAGLLTFRPGGGPGISALTALVYLAAALTDLLDGYLARRYNLVSTLGKFLDPLADKLLAASAFIMLLPLGRVPAWIVFLILARELAVTGLRAVAAEKGLVIPASDSGKRKTLAQNIALFCLLWHYPLFWARAAVVGQAILYVALAMTYWSAILYFMNYWKAARAPEAD